MDDDFAKRLRHTFARGGISVREMSTDGEVDWSNCEKRDLRWQPVKGCYCLRCCKARDEL